MTLASALALVDRTVERKLRALEDDLLQAGTDPGDVADLLTRHNAELNVWRGALEDVLLELIAEWQAPPPAPRVH